MEEGRRKRKERSFHYNCNVFISLNKKGSEIKIAKCKLLCMDSTCKNVKKRAFSRIQKNIFFQYCPMYNDLLNIEIVNILYIILC